MTTTTEIFVVTPINDAQLRHDFDIVQQRQLELLFVHVRIIRNEIAEYASTSESAGGLKVSVESEDRSRAREFA